MDPNRRRRFDELLEEVLAAMPPLVHELIEKVPLLVEDYPSDDVLEQMGIRRRSELCGLYTGIPLTQRSITQSGELPDVVTIYREGIVAVARGRNGRVRTAELRRQIRITILHELAHHHGLDEEELHRLGYG